MQYFLINSDTDQYVAIKNTLDYKLLLSFRGCIFGKKKCVARICINMIYERKQYLYSTACQYA